MNNIVDDYCIKNSTPASKTRKDLAKFTRENVSGAGMLIGELEGAFFQLMVKAIRANRILEIGTYTGYSALTFAEALPQDGEIYTLDINSETVGIAKEYWGKSEAGDKIKSFIGPALEKMDYFIKNKESFDIVFIDADKNNYPHYLEKAFELLSEKGIIIMDNVLWSGRAYDENNNDKQTLNIRKACQDLLQKEGFTSSMIPLRDGIMIGTK